MDRGVRRRQQGSAVRTLWRSRLPGSRRRRGGSGASSGRSRAVPSSHGSDGWRRANGDHGDICFSTFSTRALQQATKEIPGKEKERERDKGHIFPQPLARASRIPRGLFASKTSQHGARAREVLIAAAIRKRSVSALHHANVTEKPSWRLREGFPRRAKRFSRRKSRTTAREKTAAYVNHGIHRPLYSGTDVHPVLARLDSLSPFCCRSLSCSFRLLP